jgi:methylglutaconyl-CoA hydratase
MDALGGEAGLRIVVLRGNGRHFQAGADLAWISAVAKQSAAENEAVSRLTAEAIRRLDTCPVPTLGLIQGGCFGGGTGIAAACDVVVAMRTRLSISETRWGLMAGIIPSQPARRWGAAGAPHALTASARRPQARSGWSTRPVPVPSTGARASSTPCS